VARRDSKVGKVLATSGRGIASAARVVGRAAKGAFDAIDPDVRMQLADLPLVATTMFGARTETVTPLPDDGHRAIVCVHGLSGHRQNFALLRALLRVHGRTRVYSFGYDDAEALDYAAAGLARTIEEIVKVNALGDAKVDVVAHSMGGLVTRLALLDHALAPRIHTLVTLGTPHHGTLAARYLGTGRGRDLRPDSELIQRLSAQVPWATPLPRLVAFYSDADILMLPAHTATMPGADNRPLHGLSHTAYLTRLRALALIERALRDA
jgi:pimeloyl-ACP methyl ester carboxylesterase